MAQGPMTRVAVRNIAGHKLRLVLSVLAVLLGTAFVTGSFVFTSTLKGTFDGLIDDSMQGLDAQVVAQDAESSGFEGIANSGTVPASALDTIRDLPNVEKVEPQISGTAIVIRSDGTAHQTGGAPSEGIAWRDPDEAIGEASTIVAGEAPSGPDEVALPQELVESAGLEIGGPVQVYTTSQGMLEFTVSGGYEDPVDNLGYVGVAFDPERAAELFTDGESFPAVFVTGTEGIDQEQLRDELAAALPDLEVETGDEVRDAAREQIGVIVNFINYFFIAFGLVGLLVGTFIIYNTFSMLVAQRIRELALLRALGASRGQVSRSVLVEALATGFVGSILGVVSGFGLVKAILAILDAVGQPLPARGLAITATSIVVPLVLGVLVTMFSAWGPAARAGRVPPVDAMRMGAVREPSIVWRTAIGLFSCLIGVLIAIIGTWQDSTGPAASTVGVGALLLILGSFLAMPAMARPIAGGLGRVIGKPFGSIGGLAATNAGRNARRTAATAFALTLGLALVAAFSTLGASTRDSVAEEVDQGIRSDLIIQGAQSQGPPTPLAAAVPERIAELPTVGDVSVFAYGGGNLGGETTIIGSISGTPSQMFEPDVVAGTLDPGDDGIIVSQATSRSKGWSMGTTIDLITPAMETIPLTVKGVYKGDQLLGPYYVGGETYERMVPENERQSFMVFASGTDGTDLETLRSDVTEELADYPIATVMDREQFVENASAGINQMLTVIYALLGLALVIAVLGIINTLALSVIERRTEIGMLRAVGTQRRQLRGMIMLESVQIAIFGAVIGAAMGAFLGWAFVSALANQGLSVITIPWGTVAVVLVCSGVVGVVASLWPAHRAAKVSPLEAIAD